MILLGISLSALQMQPGEIFSPPISDQSTMSSSRGTVDIGWFWVMIQGFHLFLIIMLPIYILISLLSKKGRRKLLSNILKFVSLFLIVMWISEIGVRLAQPDEQTGLQSGPLDFSTISRNYNPVPNFEANPQPWMLALIIIGAAAMVAGMTFWGLKFLSRTKPAYIPQVQKFAEKAQTALDDIEEAKIDFDDVIIRCYAEMSQILRIESGIQRAQAMTTHEFERELLEKGFPARPVQQLTQLFEQVRYGRQQPGYNEKGVATESLREIIDFCRRQA